MSARPVPDRRRGRSIPGQYSPSCSTIPLIQLTSDKISIASGGQDSYVGGKLGIGTASPGYKFHVEQTETDLAGDSRRNAYSNYIIQPSGAMSSGASLVHCTAIASVPASNSAQVRNRALPEARKLRARALLRRWWVRKATPTAAAMRLLQRWPARKASRRPITHRHSFPA